MNDLDLLRRYEPVVHYTLGEMFFPCAVEGYLKACSLWLADEERHTQLMAAPGELTPATLAAFRAAPVEHRYYLQYVDAPLPPVEYQRWLAQTDHVRLPAPNRLQRVGLATRILDGLFDLSLVVRGRVPGGTAAAAQRKYAASVQQDARRVYYGRVVRTGGYIVLHYIFFFVMNDFRSTFYGVNDHESDWEQIFVYLSDEGDADPMPRWVAYASHDFSGDDLRRRWDDPEVEKVGDTHPVIYAGAGSHASYFTRGEYLMQVEPAFLAPLHGVAAALDRVWKNTLRQSGQLNLDAGMKNLLSIPFVDYARGDGHAIGPGQAETWTPILISDADGWVDGYRGLWGLDTWDPLGGERAPSGPKYNRDGSVRESWRDPLGWAGLDKVLPPREAVAATVQMLAALRAEQAELAVQIEQQRAIVRTLALEVAALQTAYLDDLYQRRQATLDAEIAKLRERNQRFVDAGETLEAGEAQLGRLRAGDFGAARAHLQRTHAPQPSLGQQSRFALWWAAVSGGLLLLVIVALLFFRPPTWPLWLAGVIVAFGAVEAGTRGRMRSYLYGVTIVLAVLNAAILLYEFWFLALVLLLVGLVVLMIRDNLREVFGG
ncbi:MAG: hypothetical protein IAE81_12335 [Caldilineaceae bacterium]|nr:hypothetical protein [Caldilineaceae bacterium]